MTSQGWREVQRALNGFGQQLEADTRAVVQRTLARVLADAKQRCPDPVPSTFPGHLRDQLRMQVARDTPAGAVWVEMTVVGGAIGGTRGGGEGTDNRGLWVEYGTVHMGAQPFLRPAAEAERGPFDANLRAAVDRRTREF